MIVRYKGSGIVANKPILLLGHMDVVEALDKDWDRPPFKLTQDDKNFYGRGSIDNKLGITMLLSTFIGLKNKILCLIEISSWYFLVIKKPAC
jgi:carboxypeptidase PM20D1